MSNTETVRNDIEIVKEHLNDGAAALNSTNTERQEAFTTLDGVHRMVIEALGSLEWTVNTAIAKFDAPYEAAIDSYSDGRSLLAQTITGTNNVDAERAEKTIGSIMRRIDGSPEDDPQPIHAYVDTLKVATHTAVKGLRMALDALGEATHAQRMLDGSIGIVAGEGGMTTAALRQLDRYEADVL